MRGVENSLFLTCIPDGPKAPIPIFHPNGERAKGRSREGGTETQPFLDSD
jgi:hypothetical protein